MATSLQAHDNAEGADLPRAVRREAVAAGDAAAPGR